MRRIQPLGCPLRARQRRRPHDRDGAHEGHGSVERRRLDRGDRGGRARRLPGGRRQDRRPAASPSSPATPRACSCCSSPRCGSASPTTACARILIFYLTQHWLFSDGKSNLIYGAYTALVYITPVLGGYLADRYLGQRKAVLFGGVLLALGPLPDGGRRRSAGRTIRRSTCSGWRSPSSSSARASSRPTSR